MIFEDNREYLEALGKYGDMVRIEQEVDWDLEAGAIVRRVCETQAPVPFFQNIKDYPGFRMSGALLSTYNRLAVALGLDFDTPIPEIGRVYIERTAGEPIPPVLIDKKNAPCKENVLLGEDADLFKLPIPMVHEGDGGRYVGTWHFVVAKDPENGELNWGMYRLMAHDRKTMAGLVLPFSDMGKMFFGRCEPNNRPLPFAAVIGPDPLSAMASSAPAAIPEDLFCGMLRGKPVEMVKCETVDLEVPAHAEIIIEGDLIPNVKIEEGPFGEYVGYRTSPREKRSVFRIKCITYRNNPILTMANMGMPTDEGQLLRSFSLSLEMDKLLRSQGIPITGVYMYPESTHHLVVVGVKPAYTNIATQIANLVFGSKLSPWFYYVVVVEDDVDIYNWAAVMHTFSTRCHPATGIRIYEQGLASPITTFLEPEDRKLGRGAQVLFDCTFPIHWDKQTERPRLISFNTAYPEEIKERVMKNWTNYGYDKK
jgi:4-hydroxy-3-polyprenylbenzoate decarboxylase